MVEEDLDALLAGRGLLRACSGRCSASCRAAWHMYPIGFLFGLGFDTATEIGLLGISATQAAQGMSLWTILVFPALFTAGMALVDTTDSVLMVGAYGWAFVNPIRKLWYNLTITAASVVVACSSAASRRWGSDRPTSSASRAGSGAWSASLNDDLANFGYRRHRRVRRRAGWSPSLIYRWKGYDRLVEGVRA